MGPPLCPADDLPRKHARETSVSPQCHCGMVSLPDTFSELSTEPRVVDFQEEEGRTRSRAAGAWRPSGFDIFVLAGALMNLMVVGYLVSHWLQSRW